MSTRTFGRFGNMNPPDSLAQHPYEMAVEPFRIMGNLYFAGTAVYSTHLIDTGDGLVILDVPPIQDMPYMLNNIWKLGFDPRDIKLIIISHAHTDHFGSVNAMRALTGAKVAISRVDAHEIASKPDVYEDFVREFGPGNETFTADIELEDGQVVEMGDTQFRCVLVPGHTLGAMAHFWTCHDGSDEYRVGIYGGAGFITLQDSMIERFGFPESLRDDFLTSIDKVWDEPVDIMLGNHPFHNDTWKKRAMQKQGKADAFVDPGEWQRYLAELKQGCEYFLSLTPEEAAGLMVDSRFYEYSGQYLGL